MKWPWASSCFLVLASCALVIGQAELRADARAPTGLSATLKSVDFTHLPDLQIDFSKPLNVDREAIGPEGRDGRLYVRIQGQVQGDKISLLLDGRPLTITNGSLDVEVELTGPFTQFHITTIAADGSLRKENFEIAFLLFQRGKLGLPEPRIWSITPSLGYSFIYYQESQSPDLMEHAVTGKISATIALPKRFDLGANVFGTIYPISNQPDTQLWFLGVNFRAGYALPWPKAPWEIKLAVGGYYTTTFCPGNVEGFNSMYGPQLFPSVKYTFSKGDTLSLYAKYSPIMVDFVPSFKSAELAAGLAWTHRLRNFHPIVVSVDTAWLNIDYHELLFIQSTSGTLSVGYGF